MSMDENKIPLKVKEIPWTKNGEVYVLADMQTQKTYQLDPISFLIWVQCDGKTKVDGIVDVFSLNGNRDIIKAAVSGILDKLTTNGLVKWV